MKSFIMVFLVFAVVSCKNAATGSKESAKDSFTTTSGGSSASTPPMNYPYSIQHPDNWEMGSSANTTVALNALRAWELGKVDESLNYFADSVRMQFDGLDKTMSKDSVKSMFTSGRNRYKTVHVKMEDWESVISKDKSEQWVTLWYTQQWVDNNGKSDSAAIINDAKIKDGKIVRLDEYTRKFH